MERDTSRSVSRQALDDVIAQACGLAPLSQREAVAALARAAFRRVEDLPPAAAARVVSGFAFLQARTQGRLAVRAFDPDPREHGYAAAGSVVEVSVEDRPLLLSTVTEYLRERGLRPAVLLHPVVGVTRDEGGHVRALGPARRAAQRESLVHLELDTRLPAERLREVVDELERALTDALAATDDHQAMRAALETAAGTLSAADVDRAEAEEATAFLRWLLDDHFLFLGSCRYELDVGADPARLLPREDSGLGVLRDPAAFPPRPPRVAPGRLVAVARTGQLATVARRARMTAIAVRLLDERGRTVGEQLVLGLFGQRTYAEPASATPVLRRLLERILDAEDVVDDSDDERQLRALFEAFPRHELFTADPEELRAALVALLAARRRQDVRLVARPIGDPGLGSPALSVLVALPRERFSPAVRHQIQDLLVDRLDAEGVDYHLSLDEQGQALLSFTLSTTGGVAALERIGLEELERQVTRLTRTFAEDLADELRRLGDTQQARRRAEDFVRRLPAGYTSTTQVATAARDLQAVEGLASGEGRVELHVTPDDPPHLRRLRVTRASTAIELSDFVPILENLGLTVTDQVQYRLAEAASGAGTSGAVYIHDFAVRADRALPAAITLDVERDGPRIAEAVLAVLRGAAVSDSLDRLVIAAGLPWTDIGVLRAYRGYRRQVGTTFTPRFSDDALVANPAVARALVELFTVRFHPGRAGEDQRPAREQVSAALAEVASFDEDRILRGFAALVEATLRTNHWAARRGRCLSLKISSDRVPDMPAPVPAVEVFVTGVDVQGVHLRGGAVARGGLRWSDRREDLRTEILGLLKAQMTKNALIVPTGAKGGFVLTRPPADPSAVPAAVRDGYADFVRGLLDVTDNVVGGRVVAPEGVRRHDGDDTYLVVAADRGTATFSDLANEIAAEYRFWLGDAFASGGSQGYDHKAMGITARGAWIAVRRHFRALDVDVQSDPVRVVGIGDMSGDVFGNGMLLSSALRLVAAFDHRHIFLDPNPDPEASYAERARLASLSRSSWDDYDRAAISPGGGVWSRTRKSIPLSPGARAALRVDSERLSPPELIRALLRAPVDLLFAGGIGTFVRATTETDLDVGDRANDAVRVTAAELGARVVGEGGNLALTQRARIQYARRGGRCNTDAIDNAGGVDTSDREVNLKILLRAAIDAGELAEAERDTLLGDLTDEVAAAVLHDVDRQIAALDWEVAASPHLIDAYEGLMGELVEAGRLRRDVEALPDSEEMARRQEAGAGLTRPELAVLLGYAKTDHADRLLASRLPDEPELADALVRYFPPRAVERFGHLLGEHRLRRELIVTVVANDLVNHMGVTYPSRTARELGCTHAEVAAGWWAACEVTDAWSAWERIEALGERLTPALQVELAEEVDRLVDTLTRGYVRAGVGGGMAEVVARDRAAFVELAKIAEDAVPRSRRADRAVRLERWSDLGIPSEVADPIATLRELSIVPDVAAVAAETDRGVRHVGEVFWRLSEALPFDDLSARLAALSPQTRWQFWQRRGLSDELRELRRAGSAMVVRTHPREEPAEAVQRFLADRAGGVRRVRTLLAALDRDGAAGMDGVAVAVRALRDGLTAIGRP